MAADDKLWLTQSELEELTGKQRWGAQSRALARMGYKFQPNAVGRPLVERTLVVSARPKPVKKSTGPDWSAVTKAA